MIDRIRAEIAQHGAWYSLATLAVILAAVDLVAESRRLRDLARSVEVDLSNRAEEVAAIMAPAIMAEYSASYDARAWGE